VTVSTHLYAAVLVGTPDIPLDIIGGSITLDAGNAPHVVAELDITPLSPPAAIDPRSVVRVRIVVDSTYPGFTHTRTFDLGVRRRDVAQLNALTHVSLASDEALIIDHAPLADDTTPDTLRASLVAIVNHVLGVAIPGTALEPGQPDQAVPVDAEDDALTWRAGQAGWDFLAPLVQAAGFRLVCDEQRAWTLRTADYTAPGSLSIRYGVNLIDGDDTLDRGGDTWFDAAVTRHTWNDSAGITQERVDAYALATPYTRLRLFEKTTPYPGAGFSRYAVSRAQGRGREVSATLVADWRTNAEQPVQIILGDAPTLTGITQAVSLDLDTDEMTVTTRTVDTQLGAIDLLVGTIDALVGTIDSL
jgi:hypothetical protein